MALSRMWIIRALSAVAILAAIGMWVLPRGNDSDAPRQPNVILISIDTCRADHLGCYDSTSKLTPNIDRFAAGATVFTNTVSAVPLTLPSHATMLTGKIPLGHGVHGNGLFVPSEHLTLPEILREEGYDTGAIVSAVVLHRRHGLKQGFETYHDQLVEAGGRRPEIHAETTSNLAAGWIQKRINDQPFFLFLHYFDPHEPYRAPGGFAERYGPSDAEQYAAEIAYTDQWIGKLFDSLKRSGLYESSLIIVTSDHGEMLGDHGEIDHGFFVYDPAIKVPLIVKLPGQREGRRVGGTAGLVDITPTVCSVVGATPPDGIQGRDLGPQLRGESAGEDRYLYSESLRPLIFYNAHPLSALVGTRWKYIHSARPELYDLSVDPSESNNLAQSQPDQAMLLSRKLRAVFADLADSGTGAGQADLDSRSRELLAGLGYAGAGRRAEMVFDSDGDDAKDLVDYHNIFTHDILDFRRAGKDEEAMAACRDLIARRPQATQAHAVLANILEAAGRNEEAVAEYTKCLELDPNESMIHVVRGELYARMGRADEALADYAEALQLDPKDVSALMAMGQLHWLMGAYEKSAQAYEAVVAIRPENAQALINLSSVYVENLDSPEKALPPAEKAHQLMPGDPRALNTYGWVLAKLGRHEEAADYLRASVGKIATVGGHYRLGWTLEQLARSNDALAQYQAALELLGDTPDEAMRKELAEAIERLGER